MVLSENSLGCEEDSDSATSSRVQKNVTAGRGHRAVDADGTTVHAGLGVRQWGPPKGGIVIGGDLQVPFGGLIDEVGCGTVV